MTATQSTAEAFGRSLSAKGGEHVDLVVLDSDSTSLTHTALFARAHPDRFFQMGISVQDMISTASGFALSGKLPFACTTAAFSARGFEQVRTAVAQMQLPVRICLARSGFDSGHEGAAAQSFDDIALFSSIPGFQVFCPADAAETDLIVDYLCRDRSAPASLRLSSAQTVGITPASASFEPGKARVVRSGGERRDLTIIACGSMVFTAIEAADALSSQGIDPAVLSMASVKPLDEKAVVDAALHGSAIVTVEEHSVIGGLGAAVSRVLSTTPSLADARPKHAIIGMNDSFGRSGRPEELKNHFGMCAENIAGTACRLLNE